MQHECSISHIGHRAEDDHELRRRYFSLPQQDSWRPPQTRSAGLMVFDHKGRLVKADSDAQLIMAATCSRAWPRLRRQNPRRAKKSVWPIFPPIFACMRWAI